MAQNKNQHYIPRVLLKRFLTQTKRGLHLFRFERNGTGYEELGLSQAASAKYFYRDGIDIAHPDALDDVLFKTESRIGPVLTDLCDSYHISQPESDNYQLMIRFIHDLYLRTPSIRAQLDAEGANQMREILKDPIFAQNKSIVDATIKQWMAGPPEQRYLSEIYLQSLGQLSSLSEESQRILHRRLAEGERKQVLAYLNRRHWRVLVAPIHGPQFVIGDEPVVIHDQQGKVRTGLKRPRSRVSIPLSPYVVLQGCYSPVENCVVQVSSFDIRKLNGVFARTAYREVFSSQPDFQWQHQAGKAFNSTDWMAGIAESTWPSNPKLGRV